jgi:hypothetical protein
MSFTAGLLKDHGVEGPTGALCVPAIVRCGETALVMAGNRQYVFDPVHRPTYRLQAREDGSGWRLVAAYATDPLPASVTKWTYAAGLLYPIDVESLTTPRDLHWPSPAPQAWHGEQARAAWEYGWGKARTACAAVTNGDAIRAQNLFRLNWFELYWAIDTALVAVTASLVPLPTLPQRAFDDAAERAVKHILPFAA